MADTKPEVTDNTSIFSNRYDDPFVRHTSNRVPQNKSSFLAAVSDVPDDSEARAKKLEPFVPQSAEVEEGYRKMMAIMGYDEHGNPLPKNNKQDVQSNVTSSQDTTRESKLNAEVPDKRPQPQSSSQNILTPSRDAVRIDTTVVPKSEPITDKTKDTNDSDPEEPQYKDEEVLPLLDSMLTRGYASETFHLRNDIPITLRCQFLWEDRMVFEHTDVGLKDYSMRTTGSFLYDMYSLASNIEKIGGVYFKPIREGAPEELKKSFEDRVKFLETLPSPLISIIALKRIEFLKKLNYVINNHEKLLKVF